MVLNLEKDARPCVGDCNCEEDDISGNQSRPRLHHAGVGRTTHQQEGPPRRYLRPTALRILPGHSSGSS